MSVKKNDVFKTKLPSDFTQVVEKSEKDYLSA